MLNRFPEFFLVDILIAIEKIKRFTKNCKTSEEFFDDDVIFSATIRELELVGEAMKHILASPKFKSLINPSWRKIVAFRNILSHAYFDLNNTKIFKVISQDLVILESELVEVARKLEDKEILLQVLEDTQKDLEKSHKIESLQYLKSLEKQIRQV